MSQPGVQFRGPCLGSCGLSESAVAQNAFCRQLRLQNTTRLLLYGDSLIGLMGYTLREPNGSVDDLHAKACHTLTYYKALRVCAGLPAVWLAQHWNPTCAERVLYHDLQPPPRSSDMLVVLHGAHSPVNPESLPAFRRFATGVTREVLAPFPGPVYVFEPLPQHFLHGAYFQNESNGDECSAPVEPQLQYWRVLIMREALLTASLKHVHVVPVFDELLFDGWHRHVGRNELGHLDCTHYERLVYLQLWDRLASVASYWSAPRVVRR